VYIKVRLATPTDGYWDGGRKQEFEFRPDWNNPNAPRRFMRWGSWSANFWFTSAVGKTQRLSAKYAIARLRAIIKKPCTIELVESEE
jgi:hypothetical protein